MHRRFSRGLREAGAMAATVALLAGCGLANGDLDGGEDPAEENGEGQEGEGGETPERPAVEERPILGAQEAEANVTLYRLDGEHMVAEFQIVNDFHERLSLGRSYLTSQFADNSAYPKDFFSGIAWVDFEGSSVEPPYHTTDRRCLCSDTDDRDNRLVEEGESLTLAAVMPAPPEDVDQVTVITSLTAPFINVPIRDEEPDLDMFDLEHPDSGDWESESLRMESVVERADRSGSVVEDSEGTSVNLSTDVLFDTGESELTSEADALIEEAADEISTAGATQVQVEGHADDTGNDAINDPLSEERAEAVRDALDERLDGGVAFEVEGFGSRQPLYDDTSEEAREQNRRVTITIPSEGDSGDADGAAHDDEADGSEGAEDSGQGGEGAPAEEFSADISGTWANDPIEAELQLTGLTRVAEDRAVLTYTITNTADERTFVWGFLRDNSPRETDGKNAEGAQIIVPETERVHLTSHVFVDEFSEEADCACTNLDHNNNELKVGASEEFYNIISIDPGATTVDVQVGDAEPFEGVAVDG